MSRDSLKYGYENVDSKEFADIYVFNTCSVTENANKETRKLIRRSKRINPNAFITLVGCYAQLKPEELINIEDVNLVLGTEDKFELLNHLDQIDFSHDIKKGIEKADIIFPCISSCQSHGIPSTCSCFSIERYLQNL